MQLKKKIIAAAVIGSALGSVAFTSNAVAAVKISGKVEAFRIAHSNGDDKRTVTGTTNPDSGSRFRITGASSEILGGETGAVAEFGIPDAGGSVNVRHSFVYVKGGWGQVILGKTDNASDGVRSANLSGSWMGPGTVYMADGSVGSSGGAGTNEEGIHYSSPSFGGLVIKYSISGESSESVGTLADGLTAAEITKTAGSAFGLFYGADFGPVAVQARYGSNTKGTTEAVDSAVPTTKEGSDSDTITGMSLSAKMNAGLGAVTVSINSSNSEVKDAATGNATTKGDSTGFGLYYGTDSFVVGYMSQSYKETLDGVDVDASSSDTTGIAVQYKLGGNATAKLGQFTNKAKNDGAEEASALAIGLQVNF